MRSKHVIIDMELYIPLLETLNEGVFKSNAFSITGLNVNASEKQIRTTADRIKIEDELGIGSNTDQGTSNAKAKSENLRNALQKIKDPTLRIIDEIFWVWPIDDKNPENDEALKRFKNSDFDGALKIWSDLKNDPVSGYIVNHNLAVVYLDFSLQWTEFFSNSHAPIEDSENQYDELKKNWNEALQRWKKCTTDESFWFSLRNTVNRINDPRLTYDTVDKIRASLDIALCKIIIESSLKLFFKGRSDLSRMLVACVRDKNQDSAYYRALQFCFKAQVQRIQQQIDHLQTISDNESDFRPAVDQFVNLCLKEKPSFDLFLGDEDNFKTAIFDKASEQCINELVAYQRKSSDNDTFVEYLTLCKRFTTSTEVNERIEKNLLIGKGNLRGTSNKPLYRLLRAIKEDDSGYAKRIERIKNEIIPQIAEVITTEGPNSEYAEGVTDECVDILRTFAASAYGEKSIAVALNALRLAQLLNKSPQLKSVIADELSTVNSLTGAGRCRFCEKEDADPSTRFESTLYGNVFTQNNQIHYNYRQVNMPQCSKCRLIRIRTEAAVAVALILILTLGPVIMILSFGLDAIAPVASIVGLIALFAIKKIGDILRGFGRMFQSLVDFVMKKRGKKGRSDIPEIKTLIDQKWKFGTKP